jgi:hypothetical protein
LRDEVSNPLDGLAYGHINGPHGTLPIWETFGDLPHTLHEEWEERIHIGTQGMQAFLDSAHVLRRIPRGEGTDHGNRQATHFLR